MSRELTTGVWHNDTTRRPFPAEPPLAYPVRPSPVYVAPSGSAALNKLQSILERPRAEIRPFDALEHAELLRALWTCVWLKPEWRRYFHIEEEDMPGYSELEDWVFEHELEYADQYEDPMLGQGSSTGAGSGFAGRTRWVKGWRLQDAQREARERGQMSGVREKGACGRVLKRYERTYVCLTCAADRSVMLCPDCWDDDLHKDHEVLFGQTTSFSSQCDCGDTTAWLPGAPQGCRRHCGARDSGDPLPTPSCPPDLRQAIHDVLTTCIEYIISTLVFAHSPRDFGNLPNTEDEMMRWAGPTSCDVDNRAGPYAVVIYSDEKHTSVEVTRQVRDALGVQWAEAERITRELEEAGRKVVFVSSRPIAAFHAASMFEQIDIGVTLRQLADVIREDIAGVMMAWIADLCASTFGGVPNGLGLHLGEVLRRERVSRHPFEGTALPGDFEDLEWDQGAARWLWLFRMDINLWKEAKWHMRSCYGTIYALNNIRGDTTISNYLGVSFRALADQYLFTDRDPDTNLLHSFCFTLFGNGRACALALANSELLQHVFYSVIAWYLGATAGGRLDYEMVATADPIPRFDAETNHMRNRKILAFYFYVRTMFRHPEVKRMIFQHPTIHNVMLRSIGFFVGLQPQQRQFDTHIEYEVDWARSFAVLTENARTVREYGLGWESAPHSDLLNALKQITRQIVDDMTLHSNRLDPARFRDAGLRAVVRILDPTSRRSFLDIDTSALPAFSFHHHLHYMLAEFMKHLARAPPDSIYMDDPEEALLASWFVNDVLRSPSTSFSNEEDYRRTLLIFEWPAESLAVLAQVRAQMWTRNGTHFRQQAAQYTEMHLRENTIDQEFFLVQVAMCVMRQDLFLPWLIDRWGVGAFFREPANSTSAWETPHGEPTQWLSMLEDLALLVLHLVTDTGNMRGETQKTKLRQHIIQQLALNNLPNSDLHKKLPERLLEGQSIIPILREVADFRVPTETNTGLYSLKEDAWDQVDPYWRKYNRGTEMPVVKDKLLARQTRQDPENTQPFIVPPPIVIPQAPIWSAMGNLTKSDDMWRLIHWLLCHCFFHTSPTEWPGNQIGQKEQGSLGTLLDYTLHLALAIAQHDPAGFAQKSISTIPSSEGMSVFQHLWFFQTQDTCKAFHSKIGQILAIIVSQLPEEATKDYRDNQQQALAAQRSNRIKEEAQSAAKDRARKLQEEFKQRQGNFAALFDEDDEDLASDAEMVDVVYGTCIVCQEDVTDTKQGGCLAFLQPSRTLRDAPKSKDWLEECLRSPVNQDVAGRIQRVEVTPAGESSSTEGFPASQTRFGAFMSMCTHIMHDQCYQGYYEATRLRHGHQVQRNHPENAIRWEFLCPLCKSLGNTLIPLTPSDANLPALGALYQGGRPRPLSDVIRRVSQEGLIKVSDSSKIWEHHAETGELLPWFADVGMMHQSLDPQSRRNNRAAARMVERTVGIASAMSSQSKRLRKDDGPMYFPSHIVGYTVSMIEIAQRGMPRPEGSLSVAEQVSETNRSLIKNLVGMLRIGLDVFFGPNYDRVHLRVGIFARFLPDWFRVATLPTPLLNRNPLGIVIETAAIAPDLLQSVIVMGYFAELTRTMISLGQYVKTALGTRRLSSADLSSLFEREQVEDPHHDEARAVFRGFKDIITTVLRNAGPFADTDILLHLVDEDILCRLLYAFTLPFLRRTAIIYYSVAGAYPMLQRGPQQGPEYTRLLYLLGITPPAQALGKISSTEMPIVTRWVTQWAMQGRQAPVLEFPGTYELLRLPERWEDVVLYYENTLCSKCHTKPFLPALCMYCGAFLCLGGDCCTEGEMGECNQHMRECGGATGMFVDIKRWVILFLYAGSGSFWHTPYLDIHGELDLQMKRGYRQIMHKGRMDELRRTTWLGHMIPHLTARKLETSSDPGGWTCL